MQSVSKLRVDAARFISEAAAKIITWDEIECVTGYNKRIDCYRFEITRRDFICGSWLSLTQFVRECRKYGGAELVQDGPHWEIYPKYPKRPGPTEDDFMAAIGPCGK